GAPITTIDVNASNIVYDNTSSGLTALDAQAAMVELASAFAALDLVDNGDGSFTLLDPQGNALGTVDKADLTGGADGLYTFTNNDGSDVQFDVRTVKIDFAGGIYTFLNGRAPASTPVKGKARNMASASTTSGLTALDAQAAIDELASAFGDLVLVDYGFGSYTPLAPIYTLSLHDALPILTGGADGLYTFTNNDGSDVQFDVRTVKIDFAGGIYTF